jgi:hypothetical protein
MLVLIVNFLLVSHSSNFSIHFSTWNGKICQILNSWISFEKNTTTQASAILHLDGSRHKSFQLSRCSDQAQIWNATHAFEVHQALQDQYNLPYEDYYYKLAVKSMPVYHSDNSKSIWNMQNDKQKHAFEGVCNCA